MKVLRTTTIAVSVFGLLATAALPASAESVTRVTASAIAQPTQVTVGFEDLDLTTAKGQETLHYRIASAAREVCGSNDLRRVGNLQIVNRNQACYEESLSRAMSAIPSAQVAFSE
jgi:UrcA family protein